MFGNCCGCSSKKNKQLDDISDGNEIKTISDNIVIKSDTLNKNVNVETEILISKSNDVNEIQLNSAGQENLKITSSQNDISIIFEQPSTISLLKRQSTGSDSKTDDYENDDVFCEGLGPPIRLAENLGTPYPHKKDESRVQLPQWFSEDDDDQEVGGTQEPPATPVGRDELALRRHRFFSDLMNAAQDFSKHKVRFNPLGPVIARDDECCQHPFNDLEVLITRLETVTDRLEYFYSATKETSNCISTIDTSIISELSNMSVLGFQDILQGPFATYLVCSQQIGSDVASHSALVEKAFQAQLQYLIIASQSKAPTNQSDQIALLQPTSKNIGAIQEFREKNRTSQYFNHLSAISESIPALGWVTVSPAPSPYVKEMNDAGQFYTNRVLKEWKEKDKKHVDWVKAWVQTLSELQAFVKQHHTTGLVWSGKNAPQVSGVPPPPPGCPPPPPTMLADISALDIGNDRSALFAQINQGENITRGLKKVTDEMQTHKNPTLRTGPAPFKPTHSSSSLSGAPVSCVPTEKSPVFTRDGKKWKIEYQKDNRNLIVDNTEMNNVVYLFKCVNSTVTVKGKINSIILDSCKKTCVVFDSVVSSVEFINCQSVQLQVLGKVPTISIDKTDGCQMYLNQESLDVEVISSKSSEMNVLVPKGNGDYSEYPVPEQYKTTVANSGLTTIAIESKG